MRAVTSCLLEMTKNVTEGGEKNREKTRSGLHPPWKPGECPPGAGRPKGSKNGYSAHLRQLLRKGFSLTEARVKAAEKVGLDLHSIDKDATVGHAIAHVIVDLALRGDIVAIKEIADRTEGKPAQSIALTGDEGGPIQVEHRGITEEQARALEDVILGFK